MFPDQDKDGKFVETTHDILKITDKKKYFVHTSSYVDDDVIYAGWEYSRGFKGSF